MNILWDKFKEVCLSVLPIVILTLILLVAFVDIDIQILGRFLIGAIAVILGLTIFLFGVDVGMTPIGNYLGRFLAERSKLIIMTSIAFIIGFVVTMAEPSLLVLGEQIASATGDVFSAFFIVIIVAFGVGLLIALGTYRLVKNVSLSITFAILYALIGVLTLFSTNEFIAMAFDASGATTGSLTTPFILAISTAISQQKGGNSAETDAFGLVGMMSTGPIIAVLLLASLQGDTFQGVSQEAYQYTAGLITPFIQAMSATFFDAFISLLPILGLFLLVQFKFLHIRKERFVDILKGVAYTIIGLTIFLVGVNQGFMDMGRYLGENIATTHMRTLPIIGLIMGMVVVLAEPAVHILGQQVADVTGGYINKRVLQIALSIGVGLALLLSAIRIVVVEVQLWHFLLPGFALAIGLSFFTPEIFTGIAFDAGGVASGPMTATFIMAFFQGVASAISNADVIVDGFGVIAMVAMIPIVMIQILGFIYKQQLTQRND